ncbi:MAG: MBL fold metallo-hydrolase [bacterium]|nr:MBL fold metallo-hydrolase [bacterium]
MRNMGSKGTGLSRRELLKGASAGALAVGFGGVFGAAAKTVQAQNAAGYTPTPSAFVTFTAGDAQVTVIQDGNTVFDPTFFAVNAPPEEVAALMEANNLPSPVLSTFNITLVRTGDRVVLIDTGVGANALDPSQPPTAGRLLPTLESLGIAAADVTDVVLTHFHPDHLFGLGDGSSIFYPNAAIYFPQAEFDFLQNGVTGNEQIDGLIAAANGFLAPAQASDQLTLYTEGEILPGFTAVPSPGHTPGHTAIMFTSGSDSVLSIADAATHPVISLQHPEWYLGFDAVPDAAVESRRSILDMAATDRIKVIGYHFSFPGVGYVVAEGDGYNFVAQV